STADGARASPIIRTIPLGSPLCVRLKWLRGRLRFSRSICPFTILLTSNAPSQAWQSNRMAAFFSARRYHFLASSAGVGPFGTLPRPRNLHIFGAYGTRDNAEPTARLVARHSSRKRRNGPR